MKKFTRLMSTSIFLLFIHNICINIYADNKVVNTNIIDQDAYTDTETHFFDGQGKRVFLDQYEGDTVLLVFWATWCGSCISEIPTLDNLAKDFRKLPFKIIAISEDYQGVEKVTRYFKEQNIRHLEIFHDYQNKLFKSMSVNGLPTAFLINRNGKIKKLFKGRIRWYDDKIRSILLAEIDGNPSVPKNSYKPPSLNRQINPPPLEDKSFSKLQKAKDSLDNKESLTDNTHLTTGKPSDNQAQPSNKAPSKGPSKGKKLLKPKDPSAPPDVLEALDSSNKTIKQ